MYAVETIICSALFYALYRLLLEGRVAHSVARAYLVLSVLLSAVIPMLELPILPPEEMAQIAANTMEFTEVATESAESGAIEHIFDWYFALQVVYIAVVLLFIIRFGVSAAKIYKLRRQSKLSCYRRVDVAESANIAEPFSFIRTIFVQRGERREQVLLHEYSHISHNHTFERLFFEFSRCVMWFNPFVHLMGNSASQVHEWQADSDVISAGFDINEYRQIIFHQLFGYSPDITCGLNKSLTKKRFIMMTTFKRGKFPLLRICAVIPIVVAMIFAFGAVAAKAEQNTVEPIANQTPKTIVEIRNGGKEILLNEKTATIEQLPELVKQSEDKVVTIVADDDVPMGAVADVKAALRESGVTKVNYSKAESKTEQSNISVTINSNGDTKSDEVAEVKEALRESGVTKVNYSSTEPKSETKTVKARNILIVNIDTNGTVSVRGKEFTNENKLKREVKKFIHNFRLLTLNTRALRVIRISGGRQYDKNSEFTTTAVKMGEGVSMACPVSKGIVSINSELPMKDPTVESVSNAVYEAFMELREKMAHRIYNKSYDKLDEAQKAEIDKVVPINISLAEKK
ncbi:MAG: biopolymer transporter ExbD [Alistipes sp.]|nr:biopolymer transporter ExbD [Alistipes sp.]